jgi:serine/threonine protein kinase
MNAAYDQFCTNCGYALDSGTFTNTPAQQNTPASQQQGGGRRITGELQAGQELGARYKIVQLIGKGGFGAVYQVNDERFHKRILAIKEMSDAQLSPAQRTQAIQDFRNEAELLVELNHPNLPKVSDFFEEGNKAYLVMEFIEGKTLETLQEEAKGPLDEETVMGWAMQLCSVLHYLHTRPRPIIFRDMKPSNVMLTADGEIKLIDFGIARIFKSAGTKDTTLLGSQGYAPLEQYGRGQSDARSDIYALGATLYDLLTKERPADAPSRHINPQLFIPPRQLNARLSAATEQIILKAMADEPGDRYQSAREMYQAIADSNIVSQGAMLSPFGTTAGIPAQQPASQNNQRPQPQQAQPVNAGTRGGYAGGYTPQQQVNVQAPGLQPQQGLASSGKPISRRTVIAGAVVVGAAVVGGAALTLSRLNTSNRGSVTGKQTGTAGTITIDIIYSTEKDAWIKKALMDFQASNPRVGNKAIQVNASSQGSVQAKDGILNGSLKPVAWSPASSLELNQLSAAWQDKHNGQDIAYTSGNYAAQTLVFSPLVFAVWQERAQLLLKKYGALNWRTIDNAINLKSWSDIGGQANWGQVKLGQTRPDDSNSGLLSITLQAYSYYKIQRGLTVQQIDNNSFQQFFQQLETAVQQFGRSSGTYLQNEVIARGPAAYDIVPIYENLVLTNQQAALNRVQQPLVPLYPELNIISDHPFVILNIASISDEEKQAARTFRDFLLSDQEQRNALLYGFRPYNPNIKLTDKIAGNSFTNQPTGITVQPDILDQAQPPSGKVVDELLLQWTKQFGSAPTALSAIPGVKEGQQTHGIIRA